MTLDKNNNVFLSANFGASGPGGIIEYSNGIAGGLGVNLGFAGGITTDKTGKILPVDKFLPGIDVFKLGFTQPSRKFTISGSNPWYPRFDKTGKDLFVSDQTLGEVHELDYASGASENTFGADWPDGRPQVTGVAVSPAAPW